MIAHYLLLPVLKAWDRLNRSASRGDVPGWVMITVMTAGLVGALYLIAQDQLNSLFTDALNSVRQSCADCGK